MKIIIIPIIFFSCFNAVAQKSKPPKPSSNFVKYKVPKLTTSMGGFADTTYLAPQMADSVLGLPLKITDVKSAPYSVLTYQFLYKKIVTTEDENTGKASKSSSLKSSYFSTTPLPALWYNAVTENLRQGEELYFFGITVKDAQGRIMYAPDLKFIIK